MKKCNLVCQCKYITGPVATSFLGALAEICAEVGATVGGLLVAPTTASAAAVQEALAAGNLKIMF